MLVIKLEKSENVLKRIEKRRYSAKNGDEKRKKVKKNACIRRSGYQVVGTKRFSIPMA
jgi:hypothetical protein